MARPMTQVAALLMLVLVAGCDFGANDDLRIFVRDSAKDMRGRVEPVPAVVQAQIPVYTASQERDPFDLHGLFDVAVQPPRPPRERSEPLEQFALDSLKLVGVVNLHGQSQVLVRTPNGVLLVGKIGGFIGQNFGQIRAIDESGIEVTELVPEAGAWVERQTRVKL